MNKVSVKIPEGLYQSVREKKLTSCAEFYYTLKRINSSGFLHKENLIEQVVPYTTLSRPSIYRMVKQLGEMGMIKTVSNGYRIASYTQFFKALGISEKVRYRKVWVTNNEKVLKWSAFFELKRKFRSQKLAALQAIKHDEVYQRAWRDTNGNLDDRLDHLANKFVAYMANQNRIAKQAVQYCELKGIEPIKQCNPDITLSFEGIRKLLNLRSTSQAYDVMKELEALSMLTIENGRKVLMETGSNLLQFLRKYNWKQYVYEKGSIYQRLPNKYYMSI